MFDALKARLEEIQQIDGRLDDAAIAVATELRGKVRQSKRGAQRRRRDLRLELRISGFSPREVRARVRTKRFGSGISIDGEAVGMAVRVTASTQVQHFRRVNSETYDLVEAFRKHLPMLNAYRARRRAG